MNKQIVWTRNSIPKTCPAGYKDSLHIYVPVNGIMPNDPTKIYDCSTIPNPPHTGAPDGFPWVIQTSWQAQCIEHPHYDKCLLFQNAGSMEAINGYGKKCSTCEIFFHSGGMAAPHIFGSNPLWRGSAGCFTVHPSLFAEVMENFIVGEFVDCVLIDNTGFIGD
jgi:hypothetical protein